MLSKAKYEARHVNDEETGLARWIVFDTFQQKPCFGEDYEHHSIAIKRAAALNHAYERTL